MLEEYTVAAVPARTAYYVWGNYIDELLFIWNADSQLAAHALQDHLFSTVALIDVTDGTVLERYEYNAYGNCRFLNPTTYAPLATQASTVGNPYTFTGRRLDMLDASDYNIYYYRERYYDADMGRFLQKDPLGVVPFGSKNNPFNIWRQYADGVNIYEYVKSMPLDCKDPWGLVKIVEYHNKGWKGHAGLLVDGKDYDFGPRDGKTVGWSEGMAPWGTTDDRFRNNKGDGASTYELKLSKRGFMLIGPKKRYKCKCLTLRNAAICIKNSARIWNGMPYHSVINNCRNFVYDTKRQCCLENK